MQDKELERLLQEKADEIKMRDFSEVWEEIKGEIQEPVKEKKFRWKKWLPMILASTGIIVCLAFLPVIINSLKSSLPSGEVFYSEDLKQKTANEEEMLDGLSQAQIKLVDISKYSVIDCKLFTTDKNKIKGANFILFDKTLSSFYTEMQIYDKSVELKLVLLTYENNCKVGSTDVYYSLQEEESDGLYRYSVYAVHNNVQYVIDYTGLTDNLIDFLTEFFA